MPYYPRYKRTRYSAYPHRMYRRVNSLYRVNRPAGIRGWYAGTRATFRRIKGIKRMPWGVIKKTYTVPELKYSDKAAFDTVPGSGAFALLNGLNLGTSSITRVGRNINIKSIHIKFEVEGAPFSGTPTTVTSVCRAMIVFDMQPNGATPLVGDLLENTTSGVQTTSSTAMRYGARFKILYDKRWVLNNQITASTSTTWSQIFDEIYLKVNLKCTYSNTNNGDITDIDSGALYLFLTSDSAAVANNPGLLYYSRIRYTDN